MANRCDLFMSLSLVFRILPGSVINSNHQVGLIETTKILNSTSHSFTSCDIIYK